MPYRDSSAVPALVGVIGGGVALLVFVGRIISVLTTQRRSLGWDDWTIAIAMALAVPPTVFAVPRTFPSTPAIDCQLTNLQCPKMGWAEISGP